MPEDVGLRSRVGPPDEGVILEVAWSDGVGLRDEGPRQDAVGSRYQVRLLDKVEVLADVGI